MAFEDVDDDTYQALLLRWNQDGSRLPTLVSEPVAAGRIKPGVNLPYAQMEVETAGAERYTCRRCIDKRRVTLRAWGTKAQASAILAALRAVFNASVRLSYPSGAPYVGWFPDGNGSLRQEEEPEEGQDVWLVELSAQAWSVRDD